MNAFGGREGRWAENQARSLYGLAGATLKAAGRVATLSYVGFLSNDLATCKPESLPCAISSMLGVTGTWGSIPASGIPRNGMPRPVGRSAPTKLATRGRSTSTLELGRVTKKKACR